MTRTEVLLRVHGVGKAERAEQSVCPGFSKKYIDLSPSDRPVLAGFPVVSSHNQS